MHAWALRAGKVERVLYNLLTNALRHTPGDGSVLIIVEPDPRRAASCRRGRRRGARPKRQRACSMLLGAAIRLGPPLEARRRAGPRDRTRVRRGARRPDLGGEPSRGGTRVSLTLPGPRLERVPDPDVRLDVPAGSAPNLDRSQAARNQVVAVLGIRMPSTPPSPRPGPRSSSTPGTAR